MRRSQALLIRERAPPAKAPSRSEKFKNIALGMAGVIASVLIPLLGLHYSNEQKSKELNKGFLELGIKILSDAPTEKNRPLRKWAIELINENSTVKIPADAENVLLDEIPIVSTSGNGISKVGLAKLEAHGLTLGVSISKFDRDIDYSKLKSRGVQFAYVRVSQGSSTKDGEAAKHVQQFAQIGVRIGLYHFFVPDSDPKEQVANFLNSLASTKWDLPPAIDCEYFPGKKVPTDYADRVYEFAAAIKSSTGIAPVIYATSSFANDHLDARFAQFPLFVAQYAKGDTAKEPTTPKYWNDYMFWHVNDQSSDAILSKFNIVAYKGTQPIAAYRGKAP